MFRISHLLVVRWTVDAGRGVRLCAESHQTCDFGHITLDQILAEQARECGGLDLERLVGPRDALARRSFLVRRFWWFQSQQPPSCGMRALQRTRKAGDAVGGFSSPQMRRGRGGVRAKTPRQRRSSGYLELRSRDCGAAIDAAWKKLKRLKS